MTWWEVTFAGTANDGETGETKIALVQAATAIDALARYAAWCGCGRCDEAIYAVAEADVDAIIPMDEIAEPMTEQVH